MSAIDNETVRIRIDPETRNKAARICGELGLELADVLRIFVTRIARDGAIPFDLNAPPLAHVGRHPFSEYDERLWAEIKPAIDAELAVALLARFVADRSTKLDEEAAAPKPNRKLVLRLTEEREEAQHAKESLDVQDPTAVRHVLDKFGALLRDTGK